MKAKFLGDPREGPKPYVPDEFTAYGVTFARGKFADVPDHLASKFENNSHYETQGKAGKAKGEPEPLVAPEFDAEEARLEAEAITAAAEQRAADEAAAAAKTGK